MVRSESGHTKGTGRDWVEPVEVGVLGFLVLRPGREPLMLRDISELVRVASAPSSHRAKMPSRGLSVELLREDWLVVSGLSND